MRKLTLSGITLMLLLAVSIAFISCTEEDDSAELGRKAAKEFCDCLGDGGTMDDCNEALNDKYKYKVNDDFIAAFDKEGTKCNVSIDR
jgi:hypothetical protein